MVYSKITSDWKCTTKTLKFNQFPSYLFQGWGRGWIPWIPWNCGCGFMLRHWDIFRYFSSSCQGIWSKYYSFFSLFLFGHFWPFLQTNQFKYLQNCIINQVDVWENTHAILSTFLFCAFLNGTGGWYVRTEKWFIVLLPKIWLIIWISKWFRYLEFLHWIFHQDLDFKMIHSVSLSRGNTFPKMSLLYFWHSIIQFFKLMHFCNQSANLSSFSSRSSLLTKLIIFQSSLTRK